MSLKDFVEGLKRHLRENKDAYVEENSWCGDTKTGFHTEVEIDMDKLMQEIDWNQGREPNTADRMLAMRAAILAYEADKAIELALQDAAKFCTSITRIHEDGRIERIDPLSIYADPVDLSPTEVEIMWLDAVASADLRKSKASHEFTRLLNDKLSSRFRAQGGDTKDPGK